MIRFISIILFFGSSFYCYCQSNMNVQQYINQFQNKITNIQRQMANELSKSSSVASRSAKKDIYVLYVDGQKLGYFADNFSCKAQATSMKRKMEGLMDDAMKSIPNKYAGNIKSQYKSLINNIRCDCRKEQNPNYQYSKSTANKGTNTKNSNPSTNPLTPPPIKSPLITGKSVEVPKSQNEIKQENKTLSDLIIGNKSNISTNTTDLLVTPETNLNFDNKTQYENPLNRLLQKSKARTNEENMITKMNAKINNEVSIKSDYTNEQTKEEIAREEWLNKLDKMSEDELKNRESIYKTYLDMASMAEYSYKDGSIKEKDLPNGWQEVKFENDPNLSNIINMANNNDDGFQCSLLMNEEGKYVLSFRGTNEIIKDGKEDVNGIFTPDSPQARLALQTTEKLLNSGIIKKENLQLTGHSLGGRLASEVAVEYGLTAYTFNSAGVSLQTKNKIRNDLEKMNNSGKIINVCSANDKLTTVQNLGSFFADNHYLKPISNFLLTNNTLKSQQKQNILDKGTILIRNALFGADVRNVGGRKVISDAYGGHSITALRTSIGRRYADIQNKLNQNY